VVICDTDIPQRLTKSWWRRSNVWSDDFNFTTTIGILGSVDSLLVATLYQGNADINHRLWNIYPPYAGVVGMLLHI